MSLVLSYFFSDLMVVFKQNMEKSLLKFVPESQ